MATDGDVAEITVEAVSPSAAATVEAGGGEAHSTAVHHQEEEDLVVGEADAIVDVRAVVIHAEHADAAEVAVVCPLRPGDPALLAVRRLARLPLHPRWGDWQRIAAAANEVPPPLRD